MSELKSIFKKVGNPQAQALVQPEQRIFANADQDSGSAVVSIDQPRKQAFELFLRAAVGVVQEILFKLVEHEKKRTSPAPEHFVKLPIEGSIDGSRGAANPGYRTGQFPGPTPNTGWAAAIRSVRPY